MPKLYLDTPDGGELDVYVDIIIPERDMYKLLLVVNRMLCNIQENENWYVE